MAILADFEGHLLLGATILSADGEIIGFGSPILKTLGSSSDFSGATEAVSSRANLGGLASM